MRDLRRLAWTGLMFAAVLAGAQAARASDQLVFCNRPERLTRAGAYADTILKKGRVHRVFFHYTNATGGSGPLVVEFQGQPGRTLTVLAQKGIADPHKHPPIAGRQAAARFLNGWERPYSRTDRVSFPMWLRGGEVASGVLRVRIPDQDAQLRILFRNSRAAVPTARVTLVDAPRREIEVALTPAATRHFFRIGAPTRTSARSWTGPTALSISSA